MSLFRRNKRAREEGDEAAAAEPGFTHAEHQTAHRPADHASPGTHAAAAPAVVGEHEPGELDGLVGEAPSSRRRGKLRRRLRHLRRVREVLLRDLGGLTFELHRVGAGEGGPVLQGKLARLAAVDREIRDLEDHLSDHRAMIVREPGIGGTCAECGELFGSEARFCWACGHHVAIGGGGAPHLAAWSTHPQLTGGEPAAPAAAPLQAPSVDSTWVEQDHPTAPLPQMDPEAVAAEPAAANEPATGDVGGESGAVWSTYVGAPAVDPPTEGIEPPSGAPADPIAQAPVEGRTEAVEPPADWSAQPAAETPAEPPTEVVEPPADRPPQPAAETPAEPHTEAAEPPADRPPQPAEEAQPAEAAQPAEQAEPLAGAAPAAPAEDAGPSPRFPPPPGTPAWPARDGDAAPELSSGDPLASPQRPSQS